MEFEYELHKWDVRIKGLEIVMRFFAIFNILIIIVLWVTKTNINTKLILSLALLIMSVLLISVPLLVQRNQRHKTKKV